MGASGNPSDHDSKPTIVMGYPSMDRYHQTQQIYPPLEPATSIPASAYPAPLHIPPQGHDHPSTVYHQQNGVANYLPPQPNPYNDFYHQHLMYNKDGFLAGLPALPTEGPDTTNKSSFGRVMLVLIIVLVISMCMMSLVMWFLFGTYIPEFKVESIKVSNFSASEDTGLKGTWNISMVVANTNHEMGINFNRVMTEIVYKGTDLAQSNLTSFRMAKMEKYSLNFSLPVEKTPSKEVIANLGKDKSNGEVIFNLMLYMEANFSGSAMTYRKDNMKVWCDSLHLKFSSDGVGTASQGKAETCLIRLHETFKR